MKLLDKQLTKMKKHIEYVKEYIPAPINGDGDDDI